MTALAHCVFYATGKPLEEKRMSRQCCSRGMMPMMSRCAAISKPDTVPLELPLSSVRFGCIPKTMPAVDGFPSENGTAKIAGTTGGCAHHAALVALGQAAPSKARRLRSVSVTSWDGLCYVWEELCYVLGWSLHSQRESR